MSEEPNAESYKAIQEGDAFLSSGDPGRFHDAASLLLAALDQ
ncbi:hypothetical protein [Bifidobacterium pseudolongum]|nr:hypothetical protein [Bifidobacterium pseudolongum]